MKGTAVYWIYIDGEKVGNVRFLSPLKAYVIDRFKRRYSEQRMVNVNTMELYRENNNRTIAVENFPESLDVSHANK